MSNLKTQFPLLQNHPELVYLDNAATTQKPESVLAAMDDFYRNYNANVHRGLYSIAERATLAYEAARIKVAKLINADPSEIIFTSGTTEAVNMIAHGLKAGHMLPDNPVAYVGEAEHHSNLLPWQQNINAEMRYLKANSDYQLEIPAETADASIVAFSIISNVTGAITDPKSIINHFPNAYSVVDAAQAIAHMAIDVKELGCDFLVFSGHKLYGPTGIGVLYGKKELLESMPPTLVGGGMIREVLRDSASWAPLPEKLEAGTPPIAEAIGLAAAVDFIQQLGWDEIMKTESELQNYTYQQLLQIPGIHLFHPAEKASGVFSFTIDGIHPHDLAQLLGEQNVCVRAGHHCAQILHRDVLQVPATTRVSLAIYNDKTDIAKLISAINHAQNILK